MPRIDAFLELGRQQGASDIHLTVGRPPLVRLDGDLAPIKYREVSADEAEAMIREILSPEQREEFEQNHSVDLSYTSEHAGRYRVNVFRQARGIGAVCRVIPQEVVSLDQLALPHVIKSFTDLNDGLVLVTGATGTGKSTTLAAMIDAINQHRNATILTLEDPVEVLHQSKRSLVVQREMGSDFHSFSDGLRSALRQDPDVILVGELRDYETIALALEAAETGHLVFGTLHTRSASQTIHRILDAFPAESQNQVSHTLADHLRAVVSQQLVRSADGRGRRAAVEILVVMPAIAKLIRDGQVFKIPDMMVSGSLHGMQQMDKSLLNLVTAGDADPDDAYRLANDKRLFAPHVTRPLAPHEMPAGPMGAAGGGL